MHRTDWSISSWDKHLCRWWPVITGTSTLDISRNWQVTISRPAVDIFDGEAKKCAKGEEHTVTNELQNMTEAPGALIVWPNGEEHSIRAPAGYLCSIFRAEMVALRAALS